MKNSLLFLSVLLSSTVWPTAWAAPISPKALPKLQDVLEPLPPSSVKVGGFLGQRFQNNATNRLLVVDEADLLAGFRNRPGRQAWIGEHVGKFLHAATLAWANNQDPKLREKIDRVASELIKTQEADGYLGTYTKDKRFGLYPNADWDVWVHKYNLIGLLTHYEQTGNVASLEACRKMADLLLNTFGPGKKSILAAGTHVGMASTSVLEPMVLLYRTTGEEKYLDFAKYLVQSWDEPNGPKVKSTLEATGKVNKTANGKAYEMLSNLVGLCELARQTGNKSLLEAPQKAWADAVANQRYITGTLSHHEHFHADHELPHNNGANMGETCVTTTWIQLNWQLLRLTGEAKYGDEIERAYYNHLAGAQLPDGSKWCYYTPLEGTKPYGNATNCCLSSGPRAIALLPQMMFFKRRLNGRETISLNLWEDGVAVTPLNGREVRVTVEARDAPTNRVFFMISGIPVDEQLWLRRPQTMDDITPQWKNVAENTWIRRQTGAGGSLAMEWTKRNNLALGSNTNAGRVVLQYGPYVLAYDEKLNPNLPSGRLVTLAANATAKPVGDNKFEVPIAFKDGTSKNAVFVPFAEAGASGSRFAVWLRAPGNFPGDDLLSLGHETRSREGNVNGSILDGETGSFVVTFDGNKAEQDWFAVELDKAMTVGRIVYAHGQNFHDGGWFDASGGKPQIQIKKSKDAAWETVGTLADYPATTATDNKGLKAGQKFTFKLPAPLSIVALRIIGKPAHGDNPDQAF
ncbi:MAG TPA: beta-L-arabinofuranosidase domain-containing protein, partial [Abditibacteriaceae bacterium]